MACHNILFICWSARPIHGTLIQAASETLQLIGWQSSYAGSAASAPEKQSKSVKSIRLTSPFRLLVSLLNLNGAPPDAIFFQSVHPSNILIGLWARLARIPIIYYLHEPNNLKEKLKKGDPPFYAALVWATQQLETRLADFIFVATKTLISQTLKNFPHTSGSVFTLPLSVPNLDESEYQKSISTIPRTRLLLLGRADSMRCLNDFVVLSKILAKEIPDIQPTILTYSKINHASPSIDTRAGKSYSNREMLDLLNESFLVWNVYNVDYAQSGVTPVALRSGLPLLVSKFEKEKRLLNGSAV